MPFSPGPRRKCLMGHSRSSTTCSSYGSLSLRDASFAAPACWCPTLRRRSSQTPGHLLATFAWRGVRFALAPPRADSPRHEMWHSAARRQYADLQDVRFHRRRRPTARPAVPGRRQTRRPMKQRRRRMKQQEYMRLASKILSCTPGRSGLQALDVDLLRPQRHALLVDGVDRPFADA